MTKADSCWSRQLTSIKVSHSFKHYKSDSKLWLKFFCTCSMCAIPFFEICPVHSEAPTLNLTLISQVFCPFGLTVLNQTGGQNNQQLFRQTAEPRGDHIAEWSEVHRGQRRDERLTMFGFCLTHEVRRLASVCFSGSSQKTNTMSLAWIHAYSTGAPLYSH